MVNKLTVALSGALVALALLVMPVLLFSSVASAAASAPNLEQGFCAGANFAIGQTGNCTTTVNSSSFQGTVTSIVNLITFIVAAIAVVMIIYGGFRYITSGGDPGKVTSAKNTILYGLIGLVIVAVAQVLTRFVLTYTDNTFN